MAAGGDIQLAVNDEGRGAVVFGTNELSASLFEPSTGWQTPERLVAADARAFDVGLDRDVHARGEALAEIEARTRQARSVGQQNAVAQALMGACQRAESERNTNL